ncbi:MAG: hypothetical protein Q7S15_02705 [bacterium]|nr:hypothetical protein [bacterium]
MDTMLRSALRANIGLRHQLEKNLLGDEGDVWEQELKKFLRKELCWVDGQEAKVPRTAPPDTLTIDYNRSLADMVKAGKYDWVNDDITAKRFPIEGKGTVELEAKLFHFNRDIPSSEEGVRLITEDDREHPWEPAKIEHLLAFGEKYPEEQCKYPIIALGSVGEVGGYRCVPVLYRDGVGRGLSLHYWDGLWSASYRFLAVRKPG